MPRGRRWTPKDDGELIARWDNDDRTLATVLDRSPKAIRARRHLLMKTHNLPKTTKTFLRKEERRALMDRYRDGTPVREIASEFGLAVAYVSAIARSEGLPMRQRHRAWNRDPTRRRELHNRMRRARADGKSYGKIAIEFDVNITTARRVTGSVTYRTLQHPPQGREKAFSCIDCDAPVGRLDTRCAACRKVAKRIRMQSYQQRYHVEHRPSPQPRPQRDPALPPYGEIITDDERIQCHECGRFYGSLVTHIRTHGLDAARYKERFELPRTSSLLGPAAAAKQRAAAIARNQGEIGRANIPPGFSRPRGLDNRLGSRINARDGQRAPAAKKATTGRREPDAPLD